MKSKEDELKALKRRKYQRILTLGERDNQWHVVDELDEFTNPFDFIKDNIEDFVEETFKIEVVYKYE